MSQKKGQYFTQQNTKVEQLERGMHRWFSRPDITGSDDLIVTEVEVEPGGGHPFHLHPDMDEVIYILSGEAEQWIEKESRTLGPGEAIYVPKEMIHATYNVGEEPLRFLAILSPAADLEGSMVYVSDREPWRSIKPEDADAGLS
ncbi:MAG: cupin domain-containing protein [Balneolaceae bacterium]